MPYCDEHNEVYRDEECPICAGRQPENTSQSDTAPSADEEGKNLDGIVNDAIEAAKKNLDADGDVVKGEHKKSVEKSNVTNIDASTTKIDNSTEVHDESTTVKDSVVNRSDIGGGDGGEEIEDSVVNRSDVGGGSTSSDQCGGKDVTHNKTESADRKRKQPEPSSREAESKHKNRMKKSSGERKLSQEKNSRRSTGNTVQNDSEDTSEADETKYCIHCRAEIPKRASHCPSCGESLEDDPY